MTPDMPAMDEKGVGCPFCGADETEVEFINSTTWCYQRCKSCGATGPRVCAGHGGDSKGAWNRRASLKAVPEVEVVKPVAGDADKWLGELLAVIHRDGGQYQAQHGVEKAVEDAHSILSALSSTPVGETDGWQPIETAPKDGTEILLYGQGVLIMDGRSSLYAKASHIGWWHDDFWVTRDPAITCRATLWQPLPASPRGFSK